MTYEYIVCHMVSLEARRERLRVSLYKKKVYTHVGVVKRFLVKL